MLIAYSTNYSAEVKERRIDPYGLVFWKSRWYVVAFCHLRSAIRSFRIDRIRELQASFGEDGPSVVRRPEGFSAREYFLRHLLPEGERAEERVLVSVRIAGIRQALTDLCDHWLLSQGIVERSTEEVSFRLDSSTLETLLPHMLLGYGRSIRIVEPQSLRERLAEVAEGLAYHYRV